MNEEHLVIWAIYDHPKDYPDHYIARKWLVTKEGSKPTEVILADVNLESLRKCLPAGLYCLPRQENDDPVLIETWL